MTNNKTSLDSFFPERFISAAQLEEWGKNEIVVRISRATKEKVYSKWKRVEEEKLVIYYFNKFGREHKAGYLLGTKTDKDALKQSTGITYAEDLRGKIIRIFLSDYRNDVVLRIDPDFRESQLDPHPGVLKNSEVSDENQLQETEELVEVKQKTKLVTKSNSKPVSLKRPFHYDVLRENIIKSANHHRINSTPSVANNEYESLLATWDSCFGKSDKGRKYQSEMIKWLFEKDDIEDLDDAQIVSMFNWLKPKRAGNTWIASLMANEELDLALAYLPFGEEEPISAAEVIGTMVSESPAGRNGGNGG